jgi:LysM repeat protein
MGKPLHILTKLGLGCLTTALILTVVWVLYRNNAPETQALAALEAPFEALSDTTPSVDVDVELPAFITTTVSEAGVRRLANPDTAIPKRPSVEVTTYEVVQGDNLFSIADRYGLKPETVLWGNYEMLRDNPQFLKPGQELNILPTNGVYYQWKAGDNLQSIASFFKVEPEKIIEYPGNHLISDLTSSEPLTIAEGAWLIIPGGVRELKDWGPPAITRENPAAAAYYGSGYRLAQVRSFGRP